MFLDWYFINIVKFFTTFYPTPLISISEVMIPNHGNGPKSTHGAGPGRKNIIQYVPLLVRHICCMLCMETTLIMPVEDILSYILKCGR